MFGFYLPGLHQSDHKHLFYCAESVHRRRKSRALKDVTSLFATDRSPYHINRWGMDALRRKMDWVNALLRHKSEHARFWSSNDSEKVGTVQTIARGWGQFSFNLCKSFWINDCFTAGYYVAVVNCKENLWSCNKIEECWTTIVNQSVSLKNNY